MPLFTRKPTPDPEPGIGGYEYPRGPAGQTGYPGSTLATREDPPETNERLHDNYNGTQPRRKWQTFATQQATWNQDNWKLPVNPDSVRATEQRNHTVVSGQIPGNQNQRNTIYNGGRKAEPGTTHSYQAAPNPGIAGETPGSVTRINRYSYNGPDGGTDLYQDTLSKRQMPYVGQQGYRGNLGHARGGIRGAVNDGTRLYQEAVFTDQGGAFGSTVRGHQRHRPTIFRQPASKNSQFYDTTADTGTPDRSGANSQITNAVLVSPHVATRRNRGF